MDSISISAQTQVWTRPRTGEAVLWALVTVLAAAATVWGLLVGRYYMVIGFGVILYAGNAARRAASAQEMRTVPVNLSVADGVLRVEMTGARLFDGRYVDQCYLCAVPDIEGAGADTSGAFHIRARRLQSFAVEAGRTLEAKTHEYTEVVFKTDAATANATADFLARNGAKAMLNA